MIYSPGYTLNSHFRLCGCTRFKKGCAVMNLRCRFCGFTQELINGTELTEHLQKEHMPLLVEAATAMGSYASSFFFTPVPEGQPHLFEALKVHRKNMLRGFQVWLNGKANGGKTA